MSIEYFKAQKYAKRNESQALRSAIGSELMLRIKKSCLLKTAPHLNLKLKKY